MADNEGGGGSAWLGFLAGIIAVALIGVAIYIYAGAGRPQQQAQLELNAPLNAPLDAHNMKINPPDVHLPSPPPAPATPPQAPANNTAPPG